MNRSQEILLSEIKRINRLYPAEEAPAKIVEFVSQEYMPRLDKAEDDPKLHPDAVISLVCQRYDMTLPEIIEKGRSADRIKVKKILCYFLCTKTDLGQNRIAKRMTYKDHTSVLHHRDSAKDLIQTDPVFRREVEILNSQL